MANIYGTQQTKIAAVPMKMGDAHSMGGRMRILSDSYTVPASGQGATDVLTIGNLPVGARIWEAHLGASATLGSTQKMSLGTIVTSSAGVTTTDAVALLGAAKHEAGGLNRTIESGQTAGTASVTPISYADGATIIVTSSVAAWTAAVVVTCTIHYTID